VWHAVKKSHEALLSESGKGIALTVSDAGVIARNALSMHPQIADKVPARLEAALGSTQDRITGEKLAVALKIAHRVRTRAAVLLVLGFITGGLGFALARRKDVYLLRCGLAMAVSAFVFAAGAFLGGMVLAAALKSEFAKELARALWPAFVGPLAVRMLVLGGMGLVVVAGVTATHRRVDLAEIARLGWRGIAGRPRRGGLGFLRAAGIALVGGFIALRPVEAMLIASVCVGGSLFFFGLQEMFVALLGLLPRVEEAASAGAGKRRTVWWRVASATVFVAAVAGAGAWWLLHDQSTAEVGSAVDACNGHPELCDRRLNEVAFATSHNSMSGGDIPDWMFPNQDKGIPAQLEDGVRGFLIDIHYGVPIGDRVKTILDDEVNARAKYEAALGKEAVEAAMRIRDRLVGEPTGERDVYLGHGFCELGATRFVDALEKINEFLVLNPGEVIIIAIQDEGVTPQDVAACFERSGLDRLVYRGPVEPPWPTLREMIASNQRVVVFAENNAEGVPWYHLLFDVCQETPYGFKDPTEFSNKPNRGGAAGSLLLMNHWIETTPTPLPSNAEIVNAYDFLLKRARACRKQRGMMPNLVAVDFYRTGDLMRVVDALNRVEKPQTASVP
jgi:hypothetical protein